MEKKELRTTMLNILKSQVQKDIPDINMDNYELILAYLPLKTEVNTIPLINKALAKGIKTAIPTSDYRFFALLTENWQNNFIQLDNGTLSIMNAQLIDISQILGETLLLVPGLAFTTDGKRLGRGSGFYDRVIAELEAKKNIEIKGVCCNSQITDYIPIEPHDRKVNSLIIC